MLPSKLDSGGLQSPFSLLYYLHHIRKRFWLLILIVLIGISVGGVQVAKTRPLFRASARVLVEQKLMSGEVVPFRNPYLETSFKDAFHQTQLKLLRSRSLARQVIAALKLEQHPEFASINVPPPPGMIQLLKSWAMPHLETFFQYIAEKGEVWLEHAPPTLQVWLGSSPQADSSPTVTTPVPSKAALKAPPPPNGPIKLIPNSQIALVNAFLRKFRIRSDLTSNLISLSFESHDPKLAALVPNTLAQLYVEEVKNKRFEEAHEGIDWLKQRVEEMESKVEESEIELERYKQENNTYSLDGRLPGVMQQLIGINSALTSIQTERIRLEALYKTVSKTDDSPNALQSMIPGLDGSVMQELKNRQDELQLDLDQLQQKYGLEHPQVVKLHTALRAQKRKINAERQRMINAAKTRYEVVRAREEALLAREGELKREVQELNEKAIRYGRLKRNVETNQRLAKVLVDRLGETNLNMKAVGGTNFKLVDPAEIPTVPINYQPVRTITMGGGGWRW